MARRRTESSRDADRAAHRPDRRTGNVEHVRSSGWAWRWTGWASWPISTAVLWVCAVAVVVDVGDVVVGAAGVVPRPDLDVAGPARSAWLLVALIGPAQPRASRAGASRAWREFLILGGPVLLVWCISYPQSVAEFRDVEGIVVAVAGEELVYRLAAVILIGALCARASRVATGATPRSGAPVPRSAASSARASCSARCPGHVDQMNGAANVLPVPQPRGAARATRRCGRVRSSPGFLVHLTIDLAALAYFAGAMPNTLRVLVDVGALVGLELGLMLAGRRLGPAATDAARHRPARAASVTPAAS